MIGAAHVVDLAAPLRATFSERVLDGVALELDEERAAALLAPGGATQQNQGRSPVILRLWAVMQRRLGEQMGGGVAGAEMRTAAEIARERNLPLFFIDDPLRETLARLLRSMSLRERLSLMVGGVIGLVLPTRIVEQQLDQYSESPAEYLEELRGAYPAVTRVLLDERNEHMADRLAELRRRGFGRIAAVVGDAHLVGL
ncbi:MAG: TraB/GumN family protein, partial [Thermoplasmata archaeon]|nr:TraB/GumN family protein [Thermoplasmata archaeon]